MKRNIATLLLQCGPSHRSSLEDVLTMHPAVRACPISGLVEGVGCRLCTHLHGVQERCNALDVQLREREARASAAEASLRTSSERSRQQVLFHAGCCALVFVAKLQAAQADAVAATAWGVLIR